MIRMPFQPYYLSIVEVLAQAQPACIKPSLL